MKDNRTAILTEVYSRLEGMGLPVYNFVPDNFNKPFIYIGDILEQQTPNKSFFMNMGVFTVELNTGIQGSSGSISVFYSYYNAIKQAMQPKTVDDFFIILREDNDTGLQASTEIEKLWIGTIQYEYALQQNETYTDRVENDGGKVEAYNCLLKKTITL